MSATGINVNCAMLDKGIYHTNQRTSGINFIINSQGMHPLNLANYIEGFSSIIISHAPFFDDGQRGSKLGSYITGYLGNANISSHHYQFIQSFFLKVLAQDRPGSEFINRYGEEPLNLRGVEVHS